MEMLEVQGITMYVGLEKVDEGCVAAGKSLLNKIVRMRKTYRRSRTTCLHQVVKNLQQAVKWRAS